MVNCHFVLVDFAGLLSVIRCSKKKKQKKKQKSRAEAIGIPES
jgi:hypothetical protein